MANEDNPPVSAEQLLEQLLSRARTEDRAPQALRTRIDADRSRLQRRRTRRPLLAGAAAALASVGVAVALVLPAGTPGAPPVSEAAALALRGPVQAAPAPDRHEPFRWLAASVQDVYFPNWAAHFGWQAAGERRDRLAGRDALTVYYTSGGRMLAYTIVGGSPLRAPGGARTRLNGYVLNSLVLDGRQVVTWQRRGHTCVVSAAGVSPSELQQLAAWR